MNFSTKTPLASYLLLVCIFLVVLFFNTNQVDAVLSGYINRNWYIAGKFSSVVTKDNKKIEANNIAYWNGEWKRLPEDSNNPGTNGPVYVVTYDLFGTVYIGGSFTSAGGVKTGPVAKWNDDKKNWEKISSGEFSNPESTNNPVVYSIVTDCANLGYDECDVYIGGVFELEVGSANQKQKYVAKYDAGESAWANIYSPAIDGAVRAIYKRGFGTPDATNKIYIGGDFSSHMMIYNKDDQQWTKLGGTSSNSGPNGAVRGFYYNSKLFTTDQLYLIGDFNFNDKDGNECKEICQYNHDEQTFIAVNTPNSWKSPDVRAITGKGEDLYVVGDIPNSVEKYLDGDWSAVGSGVDFGNTLNAIDACGADDIGCSDDSVTVGGDNVLKFYNTTDDKNTWEEFSKGIGDDTYYIYSVISAAPSQHVISMIAMVAVVVSVALFLL